MFINDLSPAAATALCSCLIVAQMEKLKRPPAPHPDLQAAYAELQRVAAHLATVYNDARIETDEMAYVARFDSSLMNMVYSWCSGQSFAEVCDSTDLFEGSIIRALRRLSELLDELKAAAKAIGNDDLFAKFDEGCGLIRRDIVFAASLYVEG